MKKKAIGVLIGLTVMLSSVCSAIAATYDNT
jgi:hypothetical protein